MTYVHILKDNTSCVFEKKSAYDTLNLSFVFAFEYEANKVHYR